MSEGRRRIAPCDAGPNAKSTPSLTATMMAKATSTGFGTDMSRKAILEPVVIRRPITTLNG